MELVKRKNVTPHHDVVQEKDDQLALDDARERRSRFDLSMAALKEGDVLTSVFNDTVTAVVSSEKNKINFCGEVMSLSATALIVAHEQGDGWTKIAGPTYWKFNGRTLTEIREQTEEDT